MDKNYNISLDIGTNSVGWAVTNDNFKIEKFKGKNMWGSYIWDEVKTAENRRLHRNARRRIDRRRKRIEYLQDILGEEVLKVDSAFFLRMKESFLFKEDSKHKNKYGNLFVDKTYKDKDFFDKYKTIYHLREKLIKSKEKEDIRLIYLALHHIVKYRGNFLYEGQKFENISNNIELEYEELKNNIYEELEIKLNISYEELIKIIEDKTFSRVKKLENILEKNKDKENKKVLKEVFNGILGLKINLKNLFDIELDELKSFDMKDENIDNILLNIEEVAPEKINILEQLKKIYTAFEFKNILTEKDYLSEAMIEKYEEYSKDLKGIKNLIRNYDKKVFNKLFRNENEGLNYYSYCKNQYKVLNNKTIKEGFFKEIENILKEIKANTNTNEVANYFECKIGKGGFLNLINSKDNVYIPYQLHEIELIKIIENQGKYYNVLEENKERLRSLVNFRIPYYVGPLDKFGKSDFSWNVRKSDKKLYPWNLEEIIDIDASAENFINGMTNKCTYLKREDVIPKNSLLYSEYMFYNEINKIKIGSKNKESYYLDKETKEKIRRELFMKKAIVKEKDIIDWAIKELNYEDVVVEGLQGDKQALCTLKPFIDFNKIFTSIDSDNREMIEKIIYWLTIFEDRKIVSRKLEEFIVKGELTKEHKSKILKLKYSGWSRFSEKLLKGIHHIDSNQRKMTIMDYLKETNENFMQIINDKKYRFDKKIKEENISEDKKFNYKSILGDSYLSPSVKSGVWNSLKLINEIIKIKGYYPQNIFIEMPREEGEKKQTVSRKNKIEKLYKDSSYKGEASKNLNKFDNKNLRQYLYFIQQGKCLYSNNILNFDTLNLYEIDHIIPQKYIKDNSIENLALVLKSENQIKEDNLPFVQVDKKSNRKAIHALWDNLYKNKLIGPKKYNILNRKNNFSEKEKVGFINRQLVETRQSIKEVINIISEIYKDEIQVVAIKAELNNNFKNTFEIYKNRNLNNYHHAKDALITGVIGTYILKRFKSFEGEYIYKKYNISNNNKSSKYKNGYIINSLLEDYKDEKFGWNSNERINDIIRQLGYKDCNIIKKLSEGKGDLFKGTIYPAKTSDKELIPIKSNINLKTSKYGYYDGVEISKNVLVEYTDKKKTIKELIGIPIKEVEKLKDEEKLKVYVRNKIKSKNIKTNSDFKIIKRNILKNQLFEIEEGRFYLASTREWHNGKEFYLDNYYEKLLYKLEKNSIDESKIESGFLDIFDFLNSKIESEYKIFSNISKKLISSKEKYKKLEYKDKIEVINQILKLLKTNAENANLKKIGLSEREGRLNNKKTMFKKITFYNYSVTGLYLKKEVF